ncbi:MAG: hypothetical protein JO306_16270, partial [Gemmatimonadetes bacterium]|nr:hypothetical protein [Gemmatimonadota bacterium]
MRIPIRPLFAVLVAAILGLLAHPPRAAAQTCVSCGSPPTITITPFSGSWTGSASTTTQAVSVKFCQSTGGTAAPGDEYITLDGTGQSFTDGNVISNCWTATGNVVLSAGTHTLTASVSNNGGTAMKSATYTYTVAVTGGVAVTPDGATGRGTTSGGAEVFSVRNTDTQSHAYTLSAVCSGGTLSSCAPGQASVTLAAGDSARVPVTHAGSGGTVYLKAWRTDATTARDSGWVNVSTGIVNFEGLPNEAGSQTTVEKSMCVKMPAGAGIFECGDLRLVRSLPGTRVLNRARQPMLVYSSQQASPHPVVATTVTNAGGTVNLTLQFTSGNANTYTAQVTGTAQATARVAISFDATSWPTGIYDYTLSAAKVNADGSQTSLGSTPGTLAIVDGYNSSFGSGWSVAGLERIVPVSNNRLLWVDGDGSSRLYLPVAGTTTRWSLDNFDRP